MSYGVPQTLAPDETIAEAAERVQRYGFEGFPVVEEGRIVGMLTRREIDRAMRHGLQRHPVSRYMRRGEVYVTPDDSVETLRRVMTEQDWGQIPVLDPHTGALLGIVTRTDLLKQWDGRPRDSAETLAQRMATALPAALLDLIKQAGKLAEASGLSPLRRRRLRARPAGGASQPGCGSGGRGGCHPAGARPGPAFRRPCAQPSPLRHGQVDPPRRPARLPEPAVCPKRSISPPPGPSSTSGRPPCPRWSAAASSWICTAAISPSTRWRFA